MTIIKRRTALVLAGLAAAAVAAPGAAQDPAGPTTIELTARDRDSRSGFVDNAPRRRESAGDLFTISASLRPEGRAYATFVQADPSHAQGSATFVLPSGRIHAAGMLDDAGSGDELVVVGGSGAYAGASGTLEVTEARGATRFRFELDR